MKMWRRWFAGSIVVLCVSSEPAETQGKVFQNQLHTFDSDTTSVVQHATQFSYDYILGNPWSGKAARQGVGAGLKVLFNSTAGDEAKWLRFNNPGGKGSPAPPTLVNGQPITSSLYAEFEKTLCIKNQAAADTDLKNKYYIATHYETTKQVLFYNNYRCSSGIDSMVHQNEWLYSLHGGAEVYEGLFLDQVNPQVAGRIPVCRNPCLTDTRELVYADQADGQLEYIRSMREHFKNTLGTKGVSGNPWRIDNYSARQHSAPLDLLYNESGKENESYWWGGVSPTVAAVQPHYNDNGHTDYLSMLRIAGVALQQGSWFGWYGGATPRKATNAVQLARALPNWDNLLDTSGRWWDSTALVYRSSNSYADPNLVYGRHPKNGKIFVVFLNTAGILSLRPGETVTAVQHTDSLFIEAGDGAGDLRISSGRVTLAKASRIGQGYILTTTAASASNRTPTARITAIHQALVEIPVQLDGGSTDADGDPLTFR